jgi:hypothetical protein
MGNIVGGLIGGVGSLLGGQSAKSNDLTGYNYLTGKNGTQGYVNNGVSANKESADLLGLNGAAGSARGGPAFQNYLNSTGYGFQMDQGTRAITGSAAARGLLNSGSTAKALTGYGQNLASTSFDNYLSKVNGQAGQGLTASGQIGEAGTSGGKAAGDAMQSGISKAGGIFGDLAATLL